MGFMTTRAKPVNAEQTETAACAADAACCPPESAVAPLPRGKAFDAELGKLCKALGHPMRVRILKILIARTTCVCGDLVSELPLAQSTVSQHLKVLKSAGLIRGDVDGPRRCYCVNTSALKRARALLAEL